MTAGPASFGRTSCHYLRDVYLPRLERALAALPPGDLWWQPHAGVISAGTILRHLDGNVRQWILSGLGKSPDQRRRATEFAQPVDVDRTVLLERLRATVEAACAVIASLDAAALAATHSIQGNPVTGHDAVYHVVEHFSWHTGQAVWLAKARAGPDHGVSFYDDDQINAASNG